MKNVRRKSFRNALLMAMAVFLPLSAVSYADDLPMASPEAMGVDSTPLVAMSKWLRNDKHNIHSMIIVKNGKVIYERYTDNLSRHANFASYSVTKVITALMLGDLFKSGALSLNSEIEPILSKARPDLAPEFADKYGITVNNLLCMSSGLGFEDPSYGSQIYFDAPDFLAHSVKAKPMTNPNTVFNYNDINPIYMSSIITQASGKTLPELAQSEIFGPLKMEHYTWSNGDQTGLNSSGWGIRLRTIDYAKIGMLMLNNGKWDGKKVIPASWIKKMETPCATSAFAGPGPLFINGYVKTEPEFTTSGFKGQFITVLPESNTVIAVNGTFDIDPDEDFFFHPDAPAGSIDPKKKIYNLMLHNYILPAIHPVGKVYPSVSKSVSLKKEMELALQSKGEPNIFLDLPDTPQR